MDLPSLHTLPREDRLYRLLPAVQRIRDAGQGYPLQALLRVIAEQVNLVEDDIARLYDNWFIETADDWAVPYLADLLGYQAVEAPLGDGAGGQALERVRVPRREVAHLISQRRRKGTVSLLEDLAFDVGAWPARAQEFFRLLDRAQHPNHLHVDRLGTADLRQMSVLDHCDGPFDSLAHSVDVRRIASRHRRGRYNVPSVGVQVWRMRSYPVTRTPAYCVEEAGAHCFTFSVLGQDAPLYRKPRPEPDAFHQADEQNLPLPLRRRDLQAHLREDYSANASLAVWAEQWAGQDGSEPVPVEAIVIADLGRWRYRPARGTVAIDPQRGRLMFPPEQVPKKGVRVSYHYGFAADLGGGEYPRPGRQPALPYSVYRVGQGGSSALPRLGDALRQWQEEAPAHAVIELMHSGVWVEPVHVRLRPGQSLVLRAADGARPVIRLIDWQTDLPDALAVEMDVGSRFALEGILLAGRPMQVSAPHDPQAYAEAAASTPACGAELAIRHCTLVPGWGIGCDCGPERASEPSLELLGVQARVVIEHSIVGSIQVRQDEVGTDPIALQISDSIIDAAGSGDAIGAMDAAVAHVHLTLRNSTVFGQVQVHAVALAENSLFDACLNVARRQLGCMRFCHIPCHCRSPRRYRCQPDEVVAAVRARHLPAATEQTLLGAERQRVRPRFQSRHYGLPGYARLLPECALEIRRGADDGAEMGVYHDLYEPQREANLRARLDQHTPAGMTVGLLFAD